MKPAWALIASVLVLALAALAALSFGRYPIALPAVVTALMHAIGVGPAGDGTAATIVLDARLPRVVAAILVGAGLSLSGASYQAVFRNPLVSPGLLGVLAGAGFGAALAIVSSVSTVFRLAFTFIGGGAAVAVGVAVALLFGRGARAGGDGGILLLVFGGLVSTALFNALLSLVKFTADPSSALPDIVFWLLGSLAGVGSGQLAQLAPALLVGIAVLLVLGRFLDVLVMTDDEARSLGVPAPALRMAVIVAATVTASLTVAIAGTIGWVGLIVPHIARLLVGPSHRRLMPVVACLGGLFLLVADTLARSLTVSEIPLGIVTDLIGVALFLLVLPRVRRGWI